MLVLHPLRPSRKTSFCKILHGLGYGNLHRPRHIWSMETKQMQNKILIHQVAENPKVSFTYDEKPKTNVHGTFSERMNCKIPLSTFVTRNEEQLQKKMHTYKQRNRCYCETSWAHIKYTCHRGEQLHRRCYPSNCRSVTKARILLP